MKIQVIEYFEGKKQTKKGMEKVDPEAADVFTAFPVQVWAHLSNPGFGTLFQSRFLPSPGLMLLYKEVLFSVPCSLCTYQG